MATLSKRDADHLLRFAWQLHETSPATARTIVERVLVADRNRADAWQVLGLLAAKQNDSARAVIALQKAVQLEQQNLDARVALAESLMDSLDYKGALRELKVCFEQDPKMRHPAGVRARVLAVRMDKDIQRRI